MRHGTDALPDAVKAESVVWLAASLSLVLSGASYLPAGWPRVLAALVGVAAAVVAMPVYVRRATAASAVVLTVTAGLLCVAAVMQLSGTSFAEGLAFSRAGGAGSPWGWLFTAGSWCLAAGLLASGRLVVSEGHDAHSLDARAYRSASLLPLVSSLGFVLIGAFPVGIDYRVTGIHNVAAIAAIGAFWIGMALTVRVGGLSWPLRVYSVVAAAVISIVWSPTVLTFLSFSRHPPMRTLHMQLLAFGLCAAWLVWLALEWDARARGRRS